MLIKQRNRLFDLETPSSLKFVYVEGKGLGIFADRGFKKGDEVISFPNYLVDEAHASFESVRVTEDQWLDSEWLTPEAFINHSCDPNMKLDFRPDQPTSAYVAIKDIAPDEEIAFNYLTIDWDTQTDAFECHCGAKNCYGIIQGLKYLTREQQEELRAYLLPYLAEKLNNPISNSRE